MKPATLRALLLSGSLLFSVLLAESGLRLVRNGTLAPLSGEHVLREPHPTRGWALAPNRRATQRTLDYAVSVATNAHGLRDRPHEFAPAAGVGRIVILGDSFMEAYQVELEDALPERLERALQSRAIEVINLGVGGYGTAQQLLQLQEVGLRYQPDLVVLAFYVGNDVQNNSPALQGKAWGGGKVHSRPFATIDTTTAALVWTPPDFERLRARADERLRRRASPMFRLWKWIEPALVANTIARAGAALGASPAPAKRHFGMPFLADPEGPEWREAWALTRWLLLAIRDTARGAGAELVILVVPAKLQVESDFRARVAALYGEDPFDEMRINRELQAFAREHEIGLLDPTPAFIRSAESGSRLYYQLEDHHWNARGHELATQELERFLNQSGLLPGQSREGAGNNSAR